MKSLFKKVSLVALAGLLVVGAAFGASLLNKDAKVSADSAKDLKIVRVNGKGTVTANPDIAHVSLAVKTVNKDIKKAQSENTKAMNKVIKAITKLGIPEKNIQTTDYNLREKYDWKNDERIFKGYEVRNSINIKVEDIKKAGTVLETAVKNGANVANGISFDIKNKEKVYNEALKLAMKSADSKATALMSEFGEKPGKPFRVDENSGYSPQYRTVMNSMMKEEEAAMDDADGAGSIQGGSLSVIATISVEYAY